VFALLHDLSVDELVMVREEINQRLNKYVQETKNEKSYTHPHNQVNDGY
jgi:hypothetical protein